MTPSGNKNAALPLLAACLLTDEPVILHNVPDIQDVQIMRKLIMSLGVEISEVKPSTWKVQAREVIPTSLDPDLCKKIRASILLAGPVTARAGELHLPPPGGDVIGRRRVDTHMLAIQKLGAEIGYDRTFHFRAEKLTGADILLDEASVTATENAIMAAAMAKGHSVIRNAASEPHIQELCHFLNLLGANIENIGSNTLHISGVDRLHGGEFTIGPDYLEVVSFIGAAAATHGSITIKDAGVQYLDMVRLVFERLGVRWESQGDDIFVPAEQKMEVEPDLGGMIPTINVMPWPAFPTDLMSIAIVLGTQAKGTVLFHDWMYPSRMFFTDKLVGMAPKLYFATPTGASCRDLPSLQVKKWKARIFAPGWRLCLPPCLPGEDQSFAILGKLTGAMNMWMRNYGILVQGLNGNLENKKGAFQGAFFSGLTTSRN